MTEPTPKSKTAQMRAAYRKHQKRLAFWQPLPGVCFVAAVIVGGASKSAFGIEKGIWVMMLLLVLSGVLQLYVRHLKNDQSIVKFDDLPHAASGVCPDCGERLEFTIDQKKLSRKNFVAHLVSWAFPFLPIANAIFILVFFPKGEDISIILVPLLLILTLPFLIAFDRLNQPRSAVCRQCGFDEPIGLDFTNTKRSFAIQFIEKFWLPIFRFKWYIFLILIFGSFGLPFVFSGSEYDVLDLFMSSMFISAFMFFVGTNNVKFYEGYFDLPKKEPKEKSAAQATDAVAHHP